MLRKKKKGNETDLPNEAQKEFKNYGKTEKNTMDE